MDEKSVPLIPLVIGIVGHRDLREVDRKPLEEQIRTVLTRLKTHYPSTPLVVLSALAEGADRLAARVAIEVGARLVVPLPMPRVFYETDFEARGSLEEFAALLERAEHWFELPLAGGNDKESVREPGEARDRQYAQLGAYIAEHSQVLIALWDGVSTRRLGGTAQIVAFKLEGVGEYSSHRRSLLDPTDSGPVYHILTPRLSNPHPTGEPGTVCVRFPHEYESDADAEEVFERIYARTDAFNQDALRFASGPASSWEKSRTELLPGHEVSLLTPELDAIRDTYGVADSLAVHYQAKTFRTLRMLFLGVFAVAVAFTVYGHLVETLWVLSGYLSLLLAVNVFWLVVKRKDYQNKFQDYRALAEGLRVQFFWGLAGLQDSVADHYLRKQRSELDWIRNAVRTWNMSRGGLRKATGSANAFERVQRMRLVLRRWVEPQYGYFVKAARRDEATRALLHQWAKVCVVAGVALAGVAASIFMLKHAIVYYPNLQRLHKWIEANHWVNGALTLLMALSGVAAALLHNYTEKRALSEHAKHYARMSLLFANAKLGLSGLSDGGVDARAEGLIRDLGEEALMENGDWLLLHRERPLEVPHAEGARPSVILKLLK